MFYFCIYCFVVMPIFFLQCFLLLLIDSRWTFVASDSVVCALKSHMWVVYSKAIYLKNFNPKSQLWLICLENSICVCMFACEQSGSSNSQMTVFWWIVQQSFDWLLLVLFCGGVTMSVFSKYKRRSCPDGSAVRKPCQKAARQPNRCSAKPSALTDFPAVVYLYTVDSRTASTHLPPVCLSDPRSYQLFETEVLSPDKRYRHFRLVLTELNKVKCFYPTGHQGKSVKMCSWQKACKLG